MSQTESTDGQKKIVNSKMILLSQVSEITRKLKQHGVHSTALMTSAGFTYTNDGDTARCSTCGLEISEWTIDKHPFIVHVQQNPHCAFVRSITSKNKFDTSTPNKLEINQNCHQIPSAEEHPSKRAKIDNTIIDVSMETKSFKEVRCRTFSHWSSNLSVSRSQMISAGFFCCNIKDRVICLYCNLICEQWNSGTDNPEEVHKRLSPRCPYVLFVLNTNKRLGPSSVVETPGDLITIADESYTPNTSQALTNCESHEEQYVSNHTTRNQEMNEQIHRSISSSDPQLTNINLQTLSRFVAARLDLPFAQYLLNRKFRLSVIKRSLEDQLRLKQTDFTSDGDFFISCLILQRQIDHISGDRSKIVIPSVAMTNFHENDQNSIVVPLPSRSMFIDQPNADVQIESEAIIGKSHTTVSVDKTKQLSSLDSCVLCNQDERRLACIPCGHLVICATCSNSVRFCPICRQSVKSFVRIYI